jgi:hypothetical protein
MKKNLITSLLLLATAVTGASAQNYNPAEHARIETTRPDGRFVSSYAIAHNMLRQTAPRCAYRPGMNAAEFAAWQDSLRDAMRTIMKFPAPDPSQPAPQRVSSEPREGYTLEKWEFYPMAGAVGTFLVLVPDKPAAAGKTPAVLCIPGSGRTKESLAGEPELHHPDQPGSTNPRTTMALDMVREGYIAVAVDNAAAGETADQELLAGSDYDYDYDVTSRILLELGWSWLGYTSWMNMQVLDWMKAQPAIDASRIVVSGFSLGTEPMMVLGVLDPSICAFVYNDFLCQTQERALVMTLPDDKGRREFPNSIRHLIPDYWLCFNFPDVVASLAPRPIIFTEGGLDRDFRLVCDAYRTAGAEGLAECHHYPMYADPARRRDVDTIPEGIDRATFFDYANVDPKSHYFKHEMILPWIRRVLTQK